MFIYFTRPALATAKLGWVKRFGRSKPPWCADCTTISVPHISIGFATTLWNSLWNQWEQLKVKLFLERVHLTKWGTERLNCHVFHLSCVVHTISYPEAEQCLCLIRWMVLLLIVSALWAVTGLWQQLWAADESDVLEWCPLWGFFQNDVGGHATERPFIAGMLLWMQGVEGMRQW